MNQADKKQIEEMHLDCGLNDLPEYNQHFSKNDMPDENDHNEAYNKMMRMVELDNIENEKGNDHPLLNNDSPHYAMTGGMEAIEIMESIFTIEELKAWAKLTAMKYRLRMGKKDDPTKEIKKIKTFDDYYQYLDTLPTRINNLA